MPAGHAVILESSKVKVTRSSLRENDDSLFNKFSTNKLDRKFRSNYLSCFIEGVVILAQRGSSF